MVSGSLIKSALNYFLIWLIPFTSFLLSGMFQVHLVYFLLQIWKQPFLLGFLDSFQQGMFRNHNLGSKHTNYNSAGYYLRWTKTENVYVWFLKKLHILICPTEIQDNHVFIYIHKILLFSCDENLNSNNPNVITSFLHFILHKISLNIIRQKLNKQ